MTMPPLPRQTDLRKLAAFDGRVAGVVALELLPRVREEVVRRDGEATVELQCGIDEEGLRVINGRITACLQLQCQRCLQPMELPVELDVHLAMVWSEDQIPALPQRVEGIVVGEGLSDLYDLVEEELLLAIPLAPRHPEEQCSINTLIGGDHGVPGDGRENPFAALDRFRRSSS